MTTSTRAMPGLLAQIDDAPRIVAAATEHAEQSTRLFLDTADAFSIRGVALVGSGDSFVAAAIAAPVFGALVGVAAVAEESMTRARYSIADRADSRPFSPLVIVISSSGEVTRSVEAAQTAVASGSTVVALTSNPTSRLARAADMTLLLPRAQNAAGPALSGTLMAAITLIEFAIRLGEVRGRATMDESDAVRAELRQLSSAVAATASETVRGATHAAAVLAEAQHVTCLGSGPSRASAAFATAKLIEAAGVGAHHQDFEEFLHIDYFARDRSQPVLAVVGTGAAAADRANEVIESAVELGRPVVIVSDGAPHPGTTAVPHAIAARELWQPLVQLPAIAAVAAALGEVRGELPFRDSAGPWAPSTGAALVRGGQTRQAGA